MRVLLIEDDEGTAAYVVRVLERIGAEIEHCRDLSSGLNAALTAPCDVLILDRMLPDGEGLDLIARLREAAVEAPVLMLSALGSASHRVDGLERGADDYLPKPFEPAELIARVKALARRAGQQAHPAIMVSGDIELHVKARAAHRAGKSLALSPKEFDLLKYFFEHEGVTVTREMLLRDVWGMNFDPQTNVVDVNVSRLRRKLEEGFEGAVLRTVRGEGYLFGAAA